jgi:hypothetical protein
MSESEPSAPLREQIEGIVSREQRDGSGTGEIADAVLAVVEPVLARGAAEAERDVLRAALAAVEALVPAECWATRQSFPTCADCIGGTIGNATFTWDMACLPCRLRAVLSTVPRRDAPPPSGADRFIEFVDRNTAKFATPPSEPREPASEGGAS